MTVDTQAVITVIGGAGIDIYGMPQRDLRERNSNPGRIRRAPGGVARNIAENLARLGAQVRLISAVGEDQDGGMLLALGRAAGIDMQLVHQSGSAPTSEYLAVLDELGDMKIAIADMSIMAELDAERLRPCRHALAESALVIADTNLPDSGLRWLADSTGRHPLFVDTDSAAKAPRIKPYLHAVHTLKMSIPEAQALAGGEIRDESQFAVLADSLHARGVERVFVTLGDQGVFYSTNDARGSLTLAGGRGRIHNSSGAGDAFLAGLGYAALTDWPLEGALEFSLAAAELTAADIATSSPALSHRAIEKVLENRRAGNES